MEFLCWWGVYREEVQVPFMRLRVVGCDYDVGEVKKKDGYGVLKRKVQKIAGVALCVCVCVDPPP